MKKIKFNFKTIIFIISVIFCISFFKYHLFYTWDSSQYVGMATTLFTKAFSTYWNPVRGIAFPLLLKIFQTVAINKVFSFKIMTFIFYIIMLLFVQKMFKSFDISKDRKFKNVYTVLVFLLIIFNPYIFFYYHNIMTEFVSITVSLIVIYLNYNWLQIECNDKKKMLFYTLYITLIVIFMYHTKPSLAVVVLANVFLAFILAIIKEFKLKNIVIRLSMILICLLVLLSSIKIWNSFSLKIIPNKNAAESKDSFYVSRKLMNGLVDLDEKFNSDNTTYKDDKLILSTENKYEKLEVNLSKEEINTIKDILDDKSEYKGFIVYEKVSKPKIQYVLFTKSNYSLKEQIRSWFKIAFSHPSIILKSYIDAYLSIVWTYKYYPSENAEFINYYYKDKYATNMSYHVDEKYERFLENYKEPVVRNITSDVFFNLSSIYEGLKMMNFVLLPILLIEAIILYILNFKKGNTIFKQNLEMVLLMYSFSLGCVLCYIAFAARIDRYTLPAYIPMFLGDIFLVYILLKMVINNLSKEKKRNG